MEERGFTGQLSMQGKSLVLQVPKAEGVVVLNHLWNFSPNFYEIKENKIADYSKKKKRTSANAVVPAQRWSWPTPHHMEKLGIKTTVVKQIHTSVSENTQSW